MKLIIILSGILGLCPVLASAEPVNLQTPQGTLIGEQDNNGIRSFKGIPYAAAPTGARRWLPPVPAGNWSGERVADSYGPDCMQSAYPAGSIYYNPARHTSEDCLFLNVWAPAGAQTGLPVMVWIHGGALTRGSGSLREYNGARLARKGVVTVTINYRLGVFGYFAHPQLIAESPDHAAGNYGVLDQIEALRWVQKNIAAFGGNPDNVTLFGESAGAWSINFLLASPLAQGLFHKAIGESGARLDPRPTLETAAVEGATLASELGSNNLAALRALPADDLLRESERLRFRTDGVVDGYVIPEQPYALFAAGHQNAVPVMVGFNAHEGTTVGALAQLPANDDAYVTRMQTLYGELANEVIAVYPPNNLRQSTLDIFRDTIFGWNMVTWARFTAAADQNAWLYFFTHEQPGPRQAELGAYHASEINYVFDNMSTLLYPATTTDQAVATAMSDYWVAFARSGRPAVDGLPVWEPYTRAAPHYMIFGAVPEPATDLLPSHWDLMDKIMANRRR